MNEQIISVLLGIIILLIGAFWLRHEQYISEKLKNNKKFILKMEAIVNAIKDQMAEIGKELAVHAEKIRNLEKRKK